MLDQEKEEERPKLRGILPDAEGGEAVFLVKACRFLRLTYEIRLATFMAKQSGRRLHILVGNEFEAAPQLQKFAREHGVEFGRYQQP